MEDAAGVADLEIVTVASGAKSVRSRTHQETFHPVIGPLAEAETLHAAQQRLPERVATTPEPFVIWDVGLGAGANALAAIRSLQTGDVRKPVHLHSFDFNLEPLTFAFRHQADLGYFGEFASAASDLLESGRTYLGSIDWQVHLGDFTSLVETAAWEAPHAILYDPYSSGTNRAMWILDHFKKLFSCLQPERPCLLTSYSRSTAVRATLLLAGFHVGVGQAIAEKEETTLAANSLVLLSKPLDREWLGRVRRSTKSAPLRETGEGMPISAEDLQALEAHPQFSRA